MTFRPEQQNDDPCAASRKKRAELKARQDKILEKIRNGMTKINRAELAMLEPRDRIHYSRQLKVVG